MKLKGVRIGLVSPSHMSRRSTAGKLRDEFLNVQSFDTLLEVQVLVERCRR